MLKTLLENTAWKKVQLTVASSDCRLVSGNEDIYAKYECHVLRASEALKSKKRSRLL